MTYPQLRTVKRGAESHGPHDKGVLTIFDRSHARLGGDVVLAEFTTLDGRHSKVCTYVGAGFFVTGDHAVGDHSMQETVLGAVRHALNHHYSDPGPHKEDRGR